MRSVGPCSTSYSLAQNCGADGPLRFAGRRQHCNQTNPRNVVQLARLVRSLERPKARGASKARKFSVLCTALEHGTTAPAYGKPSQQAMLEVGNGIVLTAANAAGGVVTIATPGALSNESAGLPPPRYVVDRSIRKSDSLPMLLSLVTAKADELDAQTTANALHRLAKLHKTLQQSFSGQDYRQAHHQYVMPILEMLRPRVLQHAPQMDAWGAAMSLWAYGALKHEDKEVFDALCESLLNLRSSLKTADCSNIMYAFGRLGSMHSGLVKAVVQALLNQLDMCKPHELSISLWSFATLKCSPDPRFMEAIVDLVQWQVVRFGSQELSNVLYALGVLGYRPQVRFLQTMEHVTLTRLPHLKPQDIANSAWALAKLHYKAARLLDEIPAYVVPRLHEYSLEEQVQLLYAYSAPRHYHRVLFDALTDSLLPSLSSLTHQDVCMITWSLANFQHRPSNPAFMPALTAEVFKRMRFFKPVALAMLAKSFARLGWRSDTMLRELARMAENRLNDFKPQELSHVLHGLMQLQFHELPVYYAAVRRCIQVLEEADLASTGQSANLLYQLVPAMNSISMSCQAVGYVPWTLIDYAESKGMRIKQPVGNSHDELSSSQARDQSHAASSSSSKRDGSRKHGGGHKGHANNNSGHHHPQVNGHHRPAGSDMHQQQGAASLRVNGVNGHSRGTMVAEQDAHFPAQPTSDLPLFAQQAVHERQLEVNGKVLNLPGPIELDSFPAADHASSIKQ